MSHKTHRDKMYLEWSVSNNSPLDNYTPGSNFKAKWVCSLGHEWRTSVKERNRGSNCPFCTRKKCLPGFNDLATTHPDLAKEWDTSKNAVAPSDVLSGSTKKIWWSGECGHFWDASPNERAHKSRGCPICRGLRVQKNVNDLASKHGDLARQWSARNSKSPDEVTPGSALKVWWECPLGHEWEAVINSRVRGSGCPVCSGRQVLTGFSDLNTKNPRIASEWHPKNEGTPREISRNSNRRVWWLCDRGHEWETTVTSRVHEDSRCKKCGFGGSSKAEAEFVGFLESISSNVTRHVRAIHPSFEYDAVVGDQKIAFEFNGLYWHSQQRKPGADYHLRKTQAAESAGYQLIHIWEDDWRDRREIVKRMLARKIGVSQESRLNARSLTFREVTPREARRFLESNHIQGFSAGRWYGALENVDGIVALMVMKRRKSGDWELVRFATSGMVRGGHSKLLKQFVRDHAPRKIVTFADRGVSDGGLYKTCGFKVDKVLEPDYMYVFKNTRVHKFNFRKARFRDDPTLKYENNLTERELADLNGLPRIYDAGKVRWVWTP